MFRKKVEGPGRGPTNDDEGFFFSADFKCFWDVGPEGGPLMMVKESRFLLISNVLGRGCGAGRGTTNIDEGFFVSVDLKSFWKEVWGLKGAH